MSLPLRAPSDPTAAPSPTLFRTLLLAALLGLASCGGTQAGAPSKKRIFVTSQLFDGNLGGVAGADAKCGTVATAASLGGTWKAWISDAKANAPDRLTDAGPWYLVDGKTLVFADKAALLMPPQVPILDEKGKPSDPNAGLVWTGTHVDGTGYPEDDCTDWTVTSSGGAAGAAGALDGTWTDDKDTACDLTLSLYCFEQ